MLLTNKIYEGNLFMRYSKHLTYAERMFLRTRLNRVRHITLDPDGTKNVLTFENERKDGQWLSGDAYNNNLYKPDSN